MQAYGAPQAEIERVAAEIEAQTADPEEQPFGVHADNLRTVGAFQALRTQWQRTGMDGRRSGFLYAGVLSWLHEHVPRPRMRRELFAGLQLMETAVLAYDVERREKEGE